MHKYFEWVSGVDSEISSWESKGLSNEKITCIVKASKSQPPTMTYRNARIALLFNGDPLKQNNVTYKHGPIVNIYIVYRLVPNTKKSSFILQNCLFGEVKLTQNANIDKYKYSGYGIGFDSRRCFTHPSGAYGKNVIIFGADLSNSTHANNKTRSILVLGKDFIQGIDGTTIYTEKWIQLILL